jgi:hypothetical protein
MMKKPANLKPSSARSAAFRPRGVATLQRDFIAAASGGASRPLAAAISGGGRLTAQEAVEVYRRGRVARLTEALGETYLRCWRVLGDADFFSTAADYIARHPSTSYNLSDYGAAFPLYLAAQPTLAHAPFLGDLARLEWAFKEMFHRAPHDGLDPARLAEAAGPRRRLILGGAVSYLELDHRVLEIWRRELSNETSLTPPSWAGAQRLVLYKRRSAAVFVREISGPQGDAFKALAAGRPVEEAVTANPELNEAGAAELFGFIAEAELVVAAEETGG